MTAADGQNAAAGISVRIRKPGKRRDLATFEVKVEKDIKQCMQCRFFTAAADNALRRSV